jgi:CubicO group peptidase (beta-lactamase class C family)
VQIVHAENGSVARYGWGGGLGTLWYSWPDHGAAAVLLTQVLPPSEDLISSFISRAEQVLTT